MNIIEEIETVYNEFVEQNNKQPDIAYVKVQWDDDKEPIDYIDEIAVNGVDARIPDDAYVGRNSVSCIGQIQSLTSLLN